MPFQPRSMRAFPPRACGGCDIIRPFAGWSATRSLRRPTWCCRCSFDPGENIRHEIAAMPGNYQLSPDRLVEEIRAAADLGLGGVILFGIPAEKDAAGQRRHQRLGHHRPGRPRGQAGGPRAAGDHRRLLLRIHRSRPLRPDQPGHRAAATSTTTPRWSCWPGRRSSTPGPGPTWWPPAA